MTESRVGRAPVVSVGNLAMGGRGKTPTTALVASLLVEAGERPAILSRGYGRRSPEPEPVIVSDGTHVLADLDRSGDEPLLLARLVPGARVVVAAVRGRAAEVAEAALGATVHVLDDGFQHGSLARDVDIVLIQSDDLRGRRVPFGTLRSPVRALARAHAVVLDGAWDPESVAELDRVIDRSQTQVFTLHRTLGRPWALEPGQSGNGGAIGWRAGKVVVAAGIARPERFVAALGTNYGEVMGVVTFADHHRFARVDLNRLAAECRARGGEGVLTTEKDAMRLLPWRPLPVPVWAVPLVGRVEPALEFRAWLVERVAEARRRAA